MRQDVPTRHKQKNSTSISGFTLIEIILVLVIVSILIWASVGYLQQRTLQMRLDRASLQIQQILNAGMAYYVAVGRWPNNLNELRGTYLPDVPMRNPWGQDYFVIPVSSSAGSLPMLFVYTGITQTGVNPGAAQAAARVIAGTLPMAYTSSNNAAPPDASTPCTTTSSTCYVVASVNIPGQELSNARAVNFAGLYKHGGCVPVPQCPTDPSGALTMVPQIMVVPVSVSGKNTTGSNDVYPISSFTAYATGRNPLNDTPPRCGTGMPTNSDSCLGLHSGPAARGYWRACMRVTTPLGELRNTRTDNWGQDVTLLAITRCAPSDEPAGSTFQVFSN